MPKKKTSINLNDFLPWLLLIAGAIGFIAAFVLTVEKIELIKNPNYIPTCNISPLVSCGSVMKTWQASVFGFPNSLIGIASFAIVSTIGAGLLAGATFKRWFWLGLQFGVVFGICFVGWLFYQSVYHIGALCPYCMVVWTITIPIFWYTTLRNMRFNVIKIPKSYERFAAFAQKHHGETLICLYLVPALLILNHFWYYWKSLI